MLEYRKKEKMLMNFLDYNNKHKLPNLVKNP